MRFYLSLILLLCSISSLDAKLTAEENQKRVDTCGQEVPTVWKATFSLYIMVVIPISPKHLLARSSDLIGFDASNNKFMWRHNSSEFEPDCKDGEEYFEVPSEALKKINISTLENSVDDANYKPVNPIKGFLIGFCSSLNPYEYGRFPLVLEVADELDFSYPCLGNVTVNVGDSVMAKSALDNPKNISAGFWIDSIKEDKYIIKWDENVIGASLLINSDNKWTVLGFFYHDHPLYKKKLSPVYRLSNYLNTTCETTGICYTLPSTTPAPLPTIQPKNTDKKKIKNEENGDHLRRIELFTVLLMVFLWI